MGKAGKHERAFHVVLFLQFIDIDSRNFEVCENTEQFCSAHDMQTIGRVTPVKGLGSLNCTGMIRRCVSSKHKSASFTF